MTISVRENTEARRFEAVDESGEVAGFVEYVEQRGKRVLVHTEVDDAFEGQGVGSTLAQAALDESIPVSEVVITCPFIKAWVEKHPEYADKVTWR